MATTPKHPALDTRSRCRPVSLRSRFASRSMGRRGFTLIELLMVVVIIAILASIAIPKFASTKEKAYVSKMISDLRNLATAQEAYVSNNVGFYAGTIPAAGLVYNPSPGVAIVINEATAAGWAATASYPGLTSRTCALFSGTATPPPPAVTEGVIACTP